MSNNYISIEIIWGTNDKQYFIPSLCLCEQRLIGLQFIFFDKGKDKDKVLGQAQR